MLRGGAGIWSQTELELYPGSLNDFCQVINFPKLSFLSCQIDNYTYLTGLMYSLNHIMHLTYSWRRWGLRDISLWERRASCHHGDTLHGGDGAWGKYQEIGVQMEAGAPMWTTLRGHGEQFPWWASKGWDREQYIFTDKKQEARSLENIMCFNSFNLSPHQ